MALPPYLTRSSMALPIYWVRSRDFWASAVFYGQPSMRPLEENERELVALGGRHGAGVIPTDADSTTRQPRLLGLHYSKASAVVERRLRDRRSIHDIPRSNGNGSRRSFAVRERTRHQNCDPEKARPRRLRQGLDRSQPCSIIARPVSKWHVLGVGLLGAANDRFLTVIFDLAEATLPEARNARRRSITRHAPHHGRKIVPYFASLGHVDNLNAVLVNYAALHWFR